MGKNWDKEHLRTLSCRLRREDAEAFQEYARLRMSSVNAILVDYIQTVLSGQRMLDSTASQIIKDLAAERDALQKENNRLKKILEALQIS